MNTTITYDDDTLALFGRYDPWRAKLKQQYPGLEGAPDGSHIWW